MTLAPRQYIPQIGRQVKMRAWDDYTSRGINIWAWLKVTAIVDTTVSFQVLNGSQDTNQFSACPLAAIEPPIGWEPQYTIYCKPEQAERIVSDWFKRGIVVRANHCIGDAAGSTFQPMDNASSPHWKYPEVTDAIPAEQCPSVFRVLAVVEEELNHYQNPEHPNLRALGRSKRVAAIKVMQADGWNVRYVPYAGGFWIRRKETVVHECA